MSRLDNIIGAANTLKGPDAIENTEAAEWEKEHLKELMLDMVGDFYIERDAGSEIGQYQARLRREFEQL